MCVVRVCVNQGSSAHLFASFHLFHSSLVSSSINWKRNAQVTWVLGEIKMKSRIAAKEIQVNTHLFTHDWRTWWVLLCKTVSKLHEYIWKCINVCIYVRWPAHVLLLIYMYICKSYAMHASVSCINRHVRYHVCMWTVGEYMWERVDELIWCVSYVHVCEKCEHAYELHEHVYELVCI